MVVTDNKSIHMKLLHQIPPHKISRIQLAEVFGERYDIKTVDTEPVYQGLLLLQSIEQMKSRGVLPQDVPRMRPECYHRTLLAFLPGRILQHLRLQPSHQF